MQGIRNNHTQRPTPRRNWILDKGRFRLKWDGQVRDKGGSLLLVDGGWHRDLGTRNHLAFEEVGLRQGARAYLPLSLSLCRLLAASIDVERGNPVGGGSVGRSVERGRGGFFFPEIHRFCFFLFFSYYLR